MTMKACGGAREKMGGRSSPITSMLQIVPLFILTAFFPLSRHGYSEIQC